MTMRVSDDAVFEGDVKFPGGISTKFARDQLSEDSAAVYTVNFMDLRVHDALQTNLPGTAATDDLALISGTFGTDSPSIQTSDAKATSVTQRARFLFQLPPEYVSAGTCTLRIRGGMNTTVSDGTATVDVEAYEADGDTAVGSDLCTTAATTINSLTFGNDDFTITPTTLSAGDWLDVRITIAITDSATGTAVIGELSQIQFLLDIKG